MVALKDGAEESLKDVHLNITVATVTAISDSLVWVVAHLHVQATKKECHLQHVAKATSSMLTLFITRK